MATARKSGAKTSRATRSSKPAAAAKRKKVPREVIVRMYNVGFGDCFLIEFPAASGAPRRVLIDCGSIAAAASMSMSDVVERILQDATDADGKPRIDVLVCTHRHADHVSGFANPAWKDVEVKEVWFPWTENPKDEAAKKILKKQSGLAAALHAHWGSRLAVAEKAKAPAAARQEVRQWLEIALNALSNDKAMTMLHSGIRSKPRTMYLESDGSPALVDTNALPSVSAYVLGPSRSPDIIRDMDPPPGETFLRQLSGANDGDEIFEPFADDWPIDPANYQWPAQVSERERHAMQEAALQWDPAITVALEKAVNGTSLVLVFEIEDTVLFFPGDAQWGTWQALMADRKSAALLSRAAFWKVGHHGSHNATPQDFVNQTILPTCCAMMSTKTGKWDSIPRRPLLDAIRDKGIDLARSDQGKTAPSPRFFWEKDTFIETRIPL